MAVIPVSLNHKDWKYVAILNASLCYQKSGWILTCMIKDHFSLKNTADLHVSKIIFLLEHFITIAYEVLEKGKVLQSWKHLFFTCLPTDTSFP